MKTILGVKVLGHDTGAAIIRDGKMVAISEERLNRVKYSSNLFPEKAIQYCLDAFNINAKDLDLIVSDRTAEGKLGKERGATYFNEQTHGVFKDVKQIMVGHHEAHAATAFFCSPFEEAAVLVYDGNGDQLETPLGATGVETESLYYGKGTNITLIDKTLHIRKRGRFTHTSGMGELYRILSQNYLRFGTHNEGKMMGLAAYGDDSLLKTFPFERWLGEQNGQIICNCRISAPLADDASFADRIARARENLRAWRARVFDGWHTAELFEPIVLPKPARDPNSALPSPYYSSVAYAAQKIFEEFARRIGTRLRTITRSENLVVAGGCGLNIDANRNFMTEVGFKNVFIQPASSDTGIPLGCALWAWHHTFGEKRLPEMRSASLGRTYSEEEILAALEGYKEKVTYKKSADVAKESAALIADRKIIGWFQGGAEYGPRALGNRSIVCDPRPKDMKDILNARVKHRELWRPFAASVLLERMREWFELDVESPFMLLMADVRKEKRADVASIVHEDGTCRIQSLTEADNGLYFRLVDEFSKLTGVPLVLNTSFNLGGEPIVETPNDALRTFLATDFDYLVLHDWIVSKKK